MPKFAIIGYSACGKSTLAKQLSDRYGVPVLYLDRVNHLPGWVERPTEESVAIVRAFLDENAERGWAIDGQYGRFLQQERFEQADEIVELRFNRFRCLYRAYKRYFTYRGKVRESSGEGCEEKLDFEFFCWILWKGRSKARREKCKRLAAEYGEKYIVLKNPRQVNAYRARHGIEEK